MKFNNNYHIIYKFPNLYIIPLEKMLNEYFILEVDDVNIIDNLKHISKIEEATYNKNLNSIIIELKNADIIQEGCYEKLELHHKYVIENQNIIINKGFPYFKKEDYKISKDDSRIKYIYYLEGWQFSDINPHCFCFNYRLFGTLPYLQGDDINIIHEGCKKVETMNYKADYQKVYCLTNTECSNAAITRNK